LICKPAILGSTSAQTPHTWAIKFRSPCTEIGDLLHRALPHATLLFVYRGAIAWVASCYQIGRRVDTPTEAPTEYALAAVQQGFGLSIRLETFYGTEPPATLHSEEALALSWSTFLEHYTQFYQAGIPFTALRYEDLKAKPQETLAALFRLCELPVDQVPNALAAFDQDSQRGTLLGRQQADHGSRQPLGEEQIARVRSVLARHPTISTPDVHLPGTLSI
jgi:hypothetical protein